MGATTNSEIRTSKRFGQKKREGIAYDCITDVYQTCVIILNEKFYKLLKLLDRVILQLASGKMAPLKPIKIKIKHDIGTYQDTKNEALETLQNGFTFATKEPNWKLLMFKYLHATRILQEILQ